ncbi:amidohydrolase family protein [Bordetella genomosp. 4]|uniref:amidohydrolase family protein n=1 Tax=Bordetella genomosp. 4 TaxID=463044 RepID=UPI0020CD24C8|nr:amidohydrolase family protein [Bordetella genomosp. 4]
MTSASFPLSTPIAIDTHAHVFTRDLSMASRRRYTPDYDATLADYLRHLDAHGLSHGVLVQPSFLGTDNRFLLSALAQARHRLRGVSVVDPVQITMQELTAMHHAGVRGIRLNLFGLPTPDLHSATWRTLCEHINPLGWHVEVHVPAVRLPEVLPPLLTADCRIVVDHFGRPDPAAGISDSGFRYLLDQAASGRVWVKLSAAYRLWPTEQSATLGHQATEQLLQAFTATRLVWGSDWPHTENQHHANYPRTVAWLRDWVTDPSTLRTLLATTPSALFDIEGDTL